MGDRAPKSWERRLCRRYRVAHEDGLLREQPAGPPLRSARGGACRGGCGSYTKPCVIVGVAGGVVTSA